MFYSPQNRKVNFRPNTVLIFSLFIVLSMFIYMRLGHVFLIKFQKMEDITYVYNVASSARGGSVYLTNIQINNFRQLLLYAPIKMLYFLIVPLPQHWRSINDVIAFLLDGVVYLYFLIMLLRHRKLIAINPLTVGLLIMLGGCVFVFGVSISNAGTALRHRHKILPAFLVLFGLIRQNKPVTESISY